MGKKKAALHLDARGWRGLVESPAALQPLLETRWVMQYASWGAGRRPGLQRGSRPTATGRPSPLNRGFRPPAGPSMCCGSYRPGCRPGEPWPASPSA